MTVSAVALFVMRKQYADLMGRWFSSNSHIFWRNRRPKRQVHEVNAALIAIVLLAAGVIGIVIGVKSG